LLGRADAILGSPRLGARSQEVRLGRLGFLRAGRSSI
jgi:hypothetical protein